MKINVGSIWKKSDDCGGYPNPDSDLMVISKKNLRINIYNWNRKNRLLIGFSRLDELIDLIESS